MANRRAQKTKGSLAHWADDLRASRFAIELAKRLVRSAFTHAPTDVRVANLLKSTVSPPADKLDDLPIHFPKPRAFFEAIVSKIMAQEGECFWSQNPDTFLLGRVIQSVSIISNIPHSTKWDGRLLPSSPSLKVLIWRAGFNETRLSCDVERREVITAERAQQLWRTAAKVGVLQLAASYAHMEAAPIVTPMQLHALSLAAVCEKALNFYLEQPSVLQPQEHKKAQAAAYQARLSVYERTKAYVEQNGEGAIHVRGMARLFRCSPEAVSQALDRLRAEGVVSSASKTRRHYGELTRQMVGVVLSCLQNWQGDPPNITELSAVLGEKDPRRVANALRAAVDLGYINRQELNEKVAVGKKKHLTPKGNSGKLSRESAALLG